MASYARNWDHFVREGVGMAGISVDLIANNHAMVEKLLLPFHLLSDPEGRVIKEWSVWTDAGGGIARPAIFAIRRDGTIGWRYVGRDFADRPTDDELFNSIRGEV
ncbi:MAG: peroxiredoxin family protein [Chloroflexi bacterium]|nr:MAG: peroxiredoxin family protein [Chloroflexota bacterium]TMF80400.1 MAG: peroxiredoxin family protein [Chloroflexota bacterium]TMF95736.1 MAG: peroxiredoxin family protein [Chloroflexota bacterium]